MLWSVVIVVVFILFEYGLGDDCYCALCELDKLPDNCTTIHGHIQIGLESTMPPFEIVEYKLENVTKLVGCITIANSGFTSLQLFSNLETIQYSQTGNSSTCATYGNIITIAKNSLLRRLYFTSLEKVIVSKKSEYGIYLVDNPSLCLTEEELERFLKTEKFYAPHIQICDPTRNYCRLDSFKFFDDTNIPDGCEVLTDSLVLNGTENENITQLQNRLDDIEQILGSILIFETDIISLEFPKLWRIYNFQPDLPVIFLQENPNLSNIEFSNLSSIPYTGSLPDILYGFMNPKLTQLSSDTCGNLKSLGELTFTENSETICENKMISNSVTQNHTNSNSGELFPDVEISQNASGTKSSIEKDGPPDNHTKDNATYRVFKMTNLLFLFYFCLFQNYNH